MKPYETEPAEPPRFATRLLQRFCEPARLEEMAGDLHELYEREALSWGERGASFLYLRRVFGIVVRCVLRSLAAPRAVLGVQLYPLRCLSVGLFACALAGLAAFDRAAPLAKLILLCLFFPEPYLILRGLLRSRRDLHE